MSDKLSLSEQLIYSTVRIESLFSNGEIGTGTGFFFNFFTPDNKVIPVIITNKHVIKDTKKGKFYLTLSDENKNPIIGKITPFEVDNFGNMWINHPNDNIDLAILPINPILKMAYETKKLIFFFTPLEKSLIPNEQIISKFTALEDIIMIGYPNGIWDSFNNIPIIRKGITATPYKINYENKDVFLIDAACFPGSSGSPVFILNEGTHNLKSGGIAFGSRLTLLGVLYAGPQHTVNGEIIIEEIPTKFQFATTSKIPNNLGFVIKSKKILDFEKILFKDKEKDT